MTGALVGLIAVLLLTDPADVPVARASVPCLLPKTSESPTLRGGLGGPRESRELHVRARRADFDREEGVALLDGNVYVEYGKDLRMTSDRLYVFLHGTNELNRVVAQGHVTVTNGLRSGSCETATFVRLGRELTMYGSPAGTVARLEDRSSRRDAVEGARIRFWLDAEQVEVEKSRMTIGSGAGRGRLL